VITPEVLIVLTDLNMYYITLFEQFYLDHLKPSFNMQLYANTSTYNSGGTGITRDEKFRTNVSLKHIGREYLDTTKEAWRTQMLGIKMSEETRARIALSYGGVGTFVQDVDSKDVKYFVTKSAAALYLNISLRTLSLTKKKIFFCKGFKILPSTDN
jgi:hypothetical protein